LTRSEQDQLKSKLEALFGKNRTVGGDQSMPALLVIGQQIGAAAGEDLIDCFPELGDYAPTASQDYLEYICRQEQEEAQRLLSREANGAFRYADLAGAFGRHNYDRVRDMFDVVDFHSSRRFVLIGCGPLPMTLYHVHDRTEIPELVALDLNAQAVATVQLTVHRFGLDRIQAHVTSGEEYDYGVADVIYVANLVRPKWRVLQRIADTAPSTTTVVLREPYSLGRLLTERGADRLDPRLEIVKSSPPELSHFSRHVFLRFSTASNV
jgi:hypothetical protein